MSNSAQKFLHDFGEGGTEGRLGLQNMSQGSGGDYCDCCTGHYFWTFWTSSKHDHITVCVIVRDGQVWFFLSSYVSSEKCFGVT